METVDTPFEIILSGFVVGYRSDQLMSKYL